MSERVLHERAAHQQRVHAHNLNEIFRSYSWRVTRPLRVSVRALAKVREVGVRQTAGAAIRRVLQRLGWGQPAPHPVPIAPQPSELVPMPTVDRIAEVLEQRMRVIAPLVDPTLSVDMLGVGALLGALVDHAATSDGYEPVWLLHIAMTGAYPDADAVRALRRALVAAAPTARVPRLLETLLPVARVSSTMLLDLDVVRGGVVADVDFCSRHVFFNTGIQRVTRSVVPEWVREHTNVVLTGWNPECTSMVTLTETEAARVADWQEARAREMQSPQPERDRGPHIARRILLPVGATVVVLESTMVPQARRIAALAQFSSNRLALVGYDCIPIVSAQYLQGEVSDTFVTYLSMVKHADTVLAISESVRDEFRGFAHALASQGLQGPECVAVPLPSPPITTHPVAAANRARLVSCVGSIEARKNQRAVLHAAERLWHEGQQFSLRFVGGGDPAFTIPFAREVAALHRQGFDVAMLTAAGDDVLDRLYATSRFTMFISMHEGFGLPVVESLAAGTPVITTNYGSVAEIARDGGCLTVDPHDDAAIVTAMRRLLTDDIFHAQLCAETQQRPLRSWADYAADAWAQVTKVPAI